MEFALAALLLVVVLSVLAYPLYRPRRREVFVPVEEEAITELLAQRDGMYATLRDLALDFEQGKLDERDYGRLRGRYMERAAEVLQRLDAAEAEVRRTDGELGEWIEREVAAMRAATRRQKSGRPRRGAAAGENGSAGENASTSANGSASANASTSATLPAGPAAETEFEGAAFLQETETDTAALQVGRAVPAGACGNCGRSFQVGDLFCARCGARLDGPTAAESAGSA